MSWKTQVRVRMHDGTSFVGDGEGESDEDAIADAMERIAEQNDALGSGEWTKDRVARVVIVMENHP